MRPVLQPYSVGVRVGDGGGGSARSRKSAGRSGALTAERGLGKPSFCPFWLPGLELAARYLSFSKAAIRRETGHSKYLQTTDFRAVRDAVRISCDPSPHGGATSWAFVSLPPLPFPSPSPSPHLILPTLPFPLQDERPAATALHTRDERRHPTGPAHPATAEPSPQLAQGSSHKLSVVRVGRQEEANNIRQSGSSSALRAEQSCRVMSVRTCTTS